jgi:hypothetical protein
MTLISSRNLIAATMLFLAVVSSGPIKARDMDWIHNKQEMEAISTLAAGYAGGLRCDRLINADVAGVYLDTVFPGRTFSPHEMAKFAKIVVGIIAAQATLVGNDPRSCRIVRADFGPSGSVIKGLLD